MFKSKELSLRLEERWLSLPGGLRKPNQAVGQHWVQCGFTMGPAQCSFGCSHCYLPRNANKVPFPSLQEMKQQIDRNREMMGPGGNIQITGGDLVDAYLGSGRGDELLELVDYAVQRDLVPMLMTHGHSLMENPDFLLELVRDAGLRKISCHIDITQGGRPGYPRRHLRHEQQLNPVRDRLVRMILDIRNRSGKRVTAAQTVTVSAVNIASIADVLEWVTASPENLDVTRTLSFQTEAMVGRTQHQENPVHPDRVWETIGKAVGLSLNGDAMLFGHPDCTSKATILVRSRDGQVVDLAAGGGQAEVWARLLSTYKGRHIPVDGSMRSMLSRGLVALSSPRFLWSGLKWLADLNRYHGLTAGMMCSAMAGKARGLNIVMHNFMDADEVLSPTSDVTTERLEACSFRGALEIDGEWKSVPMCQVNARYRPSIYSFRVASNPADGGKPAQPISVSTPKPPLESGVISPSATA